MSTKKKQKSNKNNKSTVGLIARAVFFRFLLLSLGLATIVAVAWAVYLDFEVQSRFSGKRWAVPARVYARPLEIYSGAPVSRQGLIQELTRLGYQATEKPGRAGQFKTAAQTLEVVTRPFQFWDGAESARHLQVSFNRHGVAEVMDVAAGLPADIVRLDPLLIGSIHPAHGEDRILVQLDDVPESMINALIAVEDRRYYEHHGVDLKSIARALWVNITAGSAQQGGSTLTQQLVKNFFLDPSRTLRRKLVEAVMAAELELHFGKQEILEGYLNEIYLGQDGARAVHGFGLASYFYFGKPTRELALHEQALLVGIVKGPSYYSPRRHPERAIERRNLVLDVMVREGVVTQEMADAAKAERLDVLERGSNSTTRYPAFIDLVKRQLREDYREEDLVSEGLRIYTTLDPVIQAAAEQGVVKTLSGIETDRRMAEGGLQAAAVVTSVDGGEVLALVGSRQPRFSGFNRAIDVQRPIGSLVKPAVYLAALRQPELFTLATPVEDIPITVPLEDGSEWMPENYNQQYHGTVLTYQALANSWNTSTVRVGLGAGLDQLGTALDDLGVGAPPTVFPSTMLGSLNRSPIQVAQMYQTLAAAGFRSQLNAIREVRDAYGQPLQRFPLEVEQTVAPEHAYLVTSTLQAAVKHGTGRAMRWLLPKDYQIAGKTGTTNDMRDSWFAGFSGNRVGVVWVGRDDNAPAGLTGSMGALKVWANIMSKSGLQTLEVIQPPDIEFATVEPVTGLIADENCPERIQLPFITGSVPVGRASCSAEPKDDSVVDWFKRIFR